MRCTRRLAAAASMGLVLAASAAPAPAGAQGLDQACRDAELVPSSCAGATKLAERAWAECRRAGGPDESCAGPLGRRVIRAEVAAHEGSWLDRTLTFQYELADEVPFRSAPWIGTHNSFNSTSEAPTLSHTDSNQQLSLTDQLRIGVRSLELDVHWLPSPRAGGQPAPVVCHGRGSGELHAGCTSERLLADTLGEIAAWLREHTDQALLLYVEDNVDAEEGYVPTAAAIDAALRTADGSSMVYRPDGGGAGCTDLPLDTTRKDVLRRGAQVVIVSGCGSGTAWQGLVFDWNDVEVESRAHGYRDAPVCDQDPDGDGAPEYGRDVYASKLVRYYEDSTWLTQAASNAGQASTDDGISPETAARMARCGVELLGFDQLLPGDGRLAGLAWSWADGQPSTAGGCAVQGAGGRWEARPCTERHPYSCRRPDGSWVLSGGPARPRVAANACRSRGGRLATPRTAEQNLALREAASRAGVAEVWLGVIRVHGRWSAIDSTAPRG